MFVRNSELIKMVELVTSFAKEAANSTVNEKGNDSRNPIVKYAHLVANACNVVNTMPETIMNTKNLLDSINTENLNSDNRKIVNELLKRLDDTIGVLVNDDNAIPNLDETAINKYMLNDSDKTICPYCEKSDGIEFDKMFVDKDKDIFQKITCNICNNSWGEVYKITTIKPFKETEIINTATTFENLNPILGDNKDD